MIRERGWGFSKLKRLDIYTRVPPHGYMFVSRVVAHRFHSRGRLLTDCLKSLFQESRAAKDIAENKVTKNLNIQVKRKNVCRSDKKGREKRGLTEEQEEVNERRGGACK